MKCVCLFAIILVGASSGFAQNTSLGPAEALDKLEKTWDSLESFRAVYSGTVAALQPNGQTLDVQSSGKLEMLKEKGKMKYRLNQQISVLNPDGTPQSTNRSVTLYDGERTYVINDVAGSKSVMILSPEVEAGRIPLDARALLARLQELGEVMLLDDQEIDGVSTYVFEGSPPRNNAAETSGAAKMRVYVDKATGIPSRWVLLNAKGDTVAEGHYTDIELNPELNPAQFVFELPVGATVIDMTAPAGTPGKP